MHETGVTSQPDTEAPYAGLTPDTVLDALEAVGLRSDGRMLQLNSYENRVFQVFLDDGRPLVAKFYRPERWSDTQILEEHALTLELDQQEIPVAAPLTLQVPANGSDRIEVTGDAGTLAAWNSGGGSFRFAVYPKKAGRAPDIDSAEALRWIGRSIGRLHAVGRRHPFRARRTLDVAAYGRSARNWLLDRNVIPPEAEDRWAEASESALVACQAAFDGIAPSATLRLHGDCHLGNLLWSDDGPCFVDLDDAVMGPAVQDIWMLLSGPRAHREHQLVAVLDGYENFSSFDRAELCLVEALRTLRMLHHSAWIAQRWSDPAFPLAFPWFGAGAYWSQQVTLLREQLDAMAEPPLQ